MKKAIFALFALALSFAAAVPSFAADKQASLTCWESYESEC